MGPQLALLAGFGIASSLVQGGPGGCRPHHARSRPHLADARWSRLFGMQGLVELLKSVVKIVIMTGCLGFSLMVDYKLLNNAMRTDPRMAPEIATTIVFHLTTVICIVAASSPAPISCGRGSNGGAICA